MQARREKGLCYNCDERFHPGHCCKPKFLLLLANPGSELKEQLSMENTIMQEDPTPTVAEPSAYISLHALEGCTQPQTLRVKGVIATSTVQVLVNGDSTHNFVQERVARFLGLPMSPASEFKVMVGNGAEIPCASMCKGVPIKLQSNSFEVDLYVMPLSGADVVLGVQWLKTLGPILTDYDNLTMKFISDGKLITINADVSSAASEISLHQLKRVTATASAATFFHLSLHLLQPLSPPTN